MSDNSPARMALVRLASQLPDGSSRKNLVHSKLNIRVAVNMPELIANNILSEGLGIIKKIKPTNRLDVLEYLQHFKKSGTKNKYLDPAIEALIKLTGWKPKVDKTTLAPVVSNIRHPYYEMSDSMGGVEAAIQSDPLMSKDRVLSDLYMKLEAAREALHDHLESHYRWD